MSRSYAVVVGTRPNFIKAAAFFSEARKRPDLSFVLIHTGQHFDKNMSKVFFEEMRIPRPDVQLESGAGATYAERLGGLINQLSREFSARARTTDGVIVFGDVNSSLAGALAASATRLPLIHVEAGLRSNDSRMPEETNRIIIDHLSHKLMISEEIARDNLLKEGITQGIHPVGSLMAQSIELFRNLADEQAVLESFSLEKGAYLVATIHRIENMEDMATLRRVLGILGSLSRKHTIIFPMHPGTRRRVVEQGLDDLLGKVRIIEPMGYLEFIGLILGSGGVITDSGGIQEETSHLGIPCATLRDNTERPITVEKGTNMLFPPATLSADSAAAIEEHLMRRDFKPGGIPLWDTAVAERIFEQL